MLVTLQEIVAMAEQGNYCVPAFNFYNTETVMGIIEAAEELKAKGYGIYLLSNASLRQHEYWPRIPAHVFFDGTIISADERVMKKTKGIVQIKFRNPKP